METSLRQQITLSCLFPICRLVQALLWASFEPDEIPISLPLVLGSGILIGVTCVFLASSLSKRLIPFRTLVLVLTFCMGGISYLAMAPSRFTGGASEYFAAFINGLLWLIVAVCSLVVSVLLEALVFKSTGSRDKSSS